MPQYCMELYLYVMVVSMCGLKTSCGVGSVMYWGGGDVVLSGAQSCKKCTKHILLISV
jgi:hypothetical protein